MYSTILCTTTRSKWGGMLMRFALVILLAVGSIMEVSAASVTVQAGAQRGKQQIEVGDMFYIYIQVKDVEDEPEAPSSLGGAKILYFSQTGSSSSFTSVNGKTSQSFTISYTLTARAEKEGTYTFGPITVGGVKSNQIKYTIGKASPSQGNVAPGGARQSNGGNSNGASASADADDSKPKFIGKGDSNLFLRANVSSTHVYEQEALVYTVKLYTTYDAVKFIGATAAPKFEGFVVEESKDVSKQLDYETYQGKTYATAVIARYIIFPQMTGQLKVLGNTYTISVDEREYYHDPFWGALSYSKPLQLNVTPNDLTINVKSLPLPKPADFSGGVGQFSISSTLATDKFNANQAASISYTVKGTGNLKYVQLPDLNVLYPPQLEVYTPETDIKANTGSSNVSGSVTFDYSFLPLEEGQFKIPQVKLVYFNPASGKYETSVASGYDITVGKGNATSKSHSFNAAKFNLRQLPVKAKDLKKDRRMLVNSFAYWLFFIIPVVVLLVAIIIYRRHIKLHADMSAFNSRRADKVARKRLKAAAAAMRKDDEDLFYTELLTALWGYLGDKLKMPTSELMRDNIKAVFTERGVPDNDINHLITILDKCEFAKYSPAGGREGMNASYNDTIDVINDLESFFKKNK